LLLENYAGEVAGIEVKAGSQVSSRDLVGWQLLRDELGVSFKAGIVFYAGATLLPQGEKLWAVPVSWLWEA
jgi:uncharacterized protein